MKTRIIGLLAALAVVTARAQNPDLDQMQSMLKAMQQTITNLQTEIEELKRQQAKSAALTQVGTTNGSEVQFIIPTIKRPPGLSQIVPHESMRDYQEAAQRPGSLTLDPKYRGFIPIPNTPAFVKFNAKVKLDMMNDNRNTG